MAGIKHVFPGGNTTEGFYSFYDYILPQNEANHIFCVKGGPGVGKSSFMKRIGKKMLELGYNVEFHHCSSDPNSLDGLVIPDLKIAMIDGTSPHIVDPKNPGAVDEIINLGEYWNLDGIKVHKERIIKTNQEIKRIFNNAYHYLKAAKEIMTAYEETEGLAFAKNKENRLITDFIQDLFGSIPVGDVGKDRHLFSYALTPMGITDFRDTIMFKCDTKYVVKDSPGASGKKLMQEILNEALKRGLYIECYHSPIQVNKIEDIAIPELKLSISVENDYHHVVFEYDKEIDLREFLDKDILDTLNDEINDDKTLFESLLGKALGLIQQVKKVHDSLEECYVPNMDFAKIEALENQIVERILKFA